MTTGRLDGEEELARQLRREFEERQAEVLSSGGERRTHRSRNCAAAR